MFETPLTIFNRFTSYRSSQSPKLGEYPNAIREYFCHIDYEKHKMKKLLTVSGQNNVRFRHRYLSQVQASPENYILSQKGELIPASGNNFKLSISTRLISFNFFAHSATFRNRNPLLLTYSAETTQTYKQTLTASFNFSASVLLGETPENIIIHSRITRFNNGCFTTDLSADFNGIRENDYGDLYLKGEIK